MHNSVRIRKIKAYRQARKLNRFTPSINRASRIPRLQAGVWGVGYPPVRLQAQWVKFTSGQSYEFTRLLSVSEVKQVFANTGTLEANVLFPPISRRGNRGLHPDKNETGIEAALSVEAAATLDRRSISTSEPSANDSSCWGSAASQRLTRTTIAARTFWRRLDTGL